VGEQQFAFPICKLSWFLSGASCGGGHWRAAARAATSRRWWTAQITHAAAGGVHSSFPCHSAAAGFNPEHL